MNRMSRVVMLTMVASLALASGCTESSGPAHRTTNGLPSLIVSSPLSPFASGHAAVVGDIAYVSLPPGSVPDGITAVIRDQSSGDTISVVMVDGGFDPVGIVARAGDTLSVVVTRVPPSSPISGFQVVSAGNAPRVVRTSPAPGKKDVPLNALITVVFSEPIDSTTLSTSSIQLLKAFLPVAGTVQLSDPSGLRAGFSTNAPLAERATYRLIVTTAIRGADGLRLDSSVTVSFTTGMASASGELRFSSVSVGWYHTCGVTTDSSAYCWGSNSGGALGNGTTADNPTPALVAGGYKWTSVSAGLQRTCGITTSGAAYCWGGIYGVSLGDGSTTDLSPIPVAVAGGFTWSELSVGTYHTCGVTTSGSAYCWGDNNAAQLGADSASVAAGRTCSPLTCDADARVPVAVAGGLRFTSVQAGLGTTCGIATDGVAYCWGDGGSGELGIGSVTGAETCERKGSGTGEIYSFPCSTTPIAVTGRLAFSDLRMGEGATCGLSSGGALYCWGQGILDGAPSGAAACGGYTDCSTAPVAFGAGLTFASITGATPKGCGVTTAGGAYCWGPNGPLMSDTSATSGSVSPVLVSGGLQFVSVSVSSMWGHACGLTVEWVAYCWGPNQVGQLGDGTATARSTPVKVAGQP